MSDTATELSLMARLFSMDPRNRDVLVRAAARIRELEAEVARLQEDVALDRQITKGLDHILHRVCAVIGASEGDDPVEVAERRMEEITSYEDACNNEAARARGREARLAEAGDVLFRISQGVACTIGGVTYTHPAEAARAFLEGKE